MKEQVSLYVFVAVIMIMGVIFGAVMVNALSLEQKQEVSRHLAAFVQSLNDGADQDAQQSFQQSLGLHMKWMLLIWLLGLSVIGLPLILILDFLKGVLIGFSVGVLVGQLSWKGMLFAAVSVAPQNLIVIPALLIGSASAMYFSLAMIKNRFMHRRGAVAQPFLHYTTTTLAMCVLLLGAALLEAYLSPHMMQWVTPMLTALS